MYQFDSDSSWVSPILPKQEVDTTSLPAPPLMPESEHDQVNNFEPDGDPTKTLGDLQLEHLLSNILKYGVFLASAIVLVGGLLYLIRHGAEPADYQFFQGQPSMFRSPLGVVPAIIEDSDRGIIQLGILILIATPIVRVAASLLTFLYRRDFTYITITLLVLTGLIYSLTAAYF